MRFWAEVVDECERVGLSRAEMARRAGIAESTVVKGLARKSRLRNVTRRAIQRVLDDERIQNTGASGLAA